MLLSTLSLLRCPSRLDDSPLCGGDLELQETKIKKRDDVLTGTLECAACKATYPVLAGIAVLVNDVELYLQQHAKGVSALVRDEEIPLEYRDSFAAAKAEIDTSFTEEDLESQRINALYFMNHFLRVKGSKPWWKPARGTFSAEIDRLVRTHWDNGPFAKIAAWTKGAKGQSVVELGCGVGGLAQLLNAKSYLGVDSAFASVALARHIYLGTPYPLEIKIPQDLYEGPLTGKVKAPKATGKSPRDFIVGELENLPVKDGGFDLAIVLNAIDMIPDPAAMPAQQFALLKSGGVAIQSGPYIWHKSVSEQLREALPRNIKSSSAAVEYLYEKAGFRIFKKTEHLPWLFLKHFRQIELYSVHLFAARKPTRSN